MVLNVRRGIRAFLVLASLRLAAFGCGAPEAFQNKLLEAGAAGTGTGVGGQAAGGVGGDTTPSGLAGAAGLDAGLSGTAGLDDAGDSGSAGGTGGSGGSVAGQGGNIGPDAGTAGMPSDGGNATGGAGAQGGAGGSAGQAGASGAAGSGTAGTGGGAGTAIVDYCDRGRWTETASINASTAPLGNDGDLTTRFTTGRPMQAGDYYQVDFTGTVYLTAVTLNDTQTSGSDYASSYDLYSSSSGATWTKFASGPGAPNSTTISFAKTSMRYVRVQVATASPNPGLFFSIGEFQVACTD
jgi:hypothetical protein